MQIDLSQIGWILIFAGNMISLRLLLLLLLILLLSQVLINNAGVDYESFEQGLSDVTPKLFNDTFSVNTLGPLLVTQELLKHVSSVEYYLVTR